MTPVSVCFESVWWRIWTKKATSSSCCLNEHVREVTGPEILRCSKYLVQKLGNCLPVDGFSVWFLYCFILEMSWACLGLLNILTLLLVWRRFSCQQFDFLPAEEWQRLGSNGETFTDVLWGGLREARMLVCNIQGQFQPLEEEYSHLSKSSCVACVPQFSLLIDWQAAWVRRSLGGDHKFVH